MAALLKRITAFQTITEDFKAPVAGEGTTTYTCKKCEQQTTFKNPALYAAVKDFRQMVCRHCPKEYPGFTRKDDGALECNDCALRYYKIKESEYYSCLCSMKTKRDEMAIYRDLQDYGFKLSREEYAIPGNKHKVDVRAERDGVVYWIEIDGGSHRTAKQKQLDRDFDEAFARYISEEEIENQHLIRINSIEELNLYFD